MTTFQVKLTIWMKSLLSRCKPSTSLDAKNFGKHEMLDIYSVCVRLLLQSLHQPSPNLHDAPRTHIIIHGHCHWRSWLLQTLPAVPVPAAYLSDTWLCVHVCGGSSPLGRTVRNILATGEEHHRFRGMTSTWKSLFASTIIKEWSVPQTCIHPRRDSQEEPHGTVRKQFPDPVVNILH